MLTKASADYITALKDKLEDKIRVNRLEVTTEKLKKYIEDIMTEDSEIIKRLDSKLTYNTIVSYISGLGIIDELIEIFEADKDIECITVCNDDLIEISKVDKEVVYLKYVIPGPEERNNILVYLTRLCKIYGRSLTYHENPRIVLEHKGYILNIDIQSFHMLVIYKISNIGSREKFVGCLDRKISDLIIKVKECDIELAYDLKSSIDSYKLLIHK